MRFAPVNSQGNPGQRGYISCSRSSGAAANTGDQRLAWPSRRIWAIVAKATGPPEAAHSASLHSCPNGLTCSIVRSFVVPAKTTRCDV
jgi:hypothetical protein